MQRLKSLRRSISSRSSRRRSGASTTSSLGSPRSSHDTGDSTASPSGSTQDLTSSPAAKAAVAQPRDEAEPPVEKAKEPTPEPREAISSGDAAPEVQTSPQSLTTSISDPPVIVEPPSPPSPPSPSPQPAVPSTATDTDTVTAATGREAPADSALRHRKGSLPTESPAATQEKEAEPTHENVPKQQPWVALAVASGGFAALNGVFAKLTTADLTASISKTISTRFQLGDEMVNPAVRGLFFALNLLSNAVMWGLFTRALTAHPSATKVSLINTSANFLVTAVLGVLIFAEVLPASWFGGAALLVLGTLIIGRDRAGDAVQAQTHANGNVELKRNHAPEPELDHRLAEQ